MWIHLFGSKARQVFSRLATLLLVLSATYLLPHPAAAQVKEVRRVLILNEIGTSSPGINLIDSGITSSLEKAPYKLEFYREYLDTILFPDPADQQQFRTYFLSKYRNRKPDVIITIGPSPLRLMAETHETFFPGVPVIFALPNSGAPGSPTLDSHFAGVQDAIQAGGTVDLALRLQPGSRHVVVVGGTSAFDKQVEAEVRQQLRPYEGRLDVSYLTNLDMPSLLQRLKGLSDQSVILLTSFGQDAAGTHFISGSEAAPMVVAAANAPVFGIYDLYLNHGEVGGRVSSLARDGEIAGRMAAQVLNGEKTEDISITVSSPIDTFDWRALRRWGLKESNLPAGSTVLYRQLTLWEAYRWYIIAGIAVILLQTLLIIGLVWHRAKLRKAEAERRQAEQHVRESEERFRLAVQAGTMWADEWDAITGKVVRSDEANDILGQDEPRYTTRQHILSRIPPEDRERLINAIARLSPEEPFLRLRHRLTRSDGRLIWVERRSRAHFDERGKMLRMVGMLADVTDRVQAEQALRQKENELSEAQRLAGVGSWHHDVRNDIVAWSEELYRIAGRDPTLPAPNYKELPRHFTAESWGRLDRVVQGAMRDGTSYELDLEMVRPDGTTRWVRARGEAADDTTGSVQLRGTAQDITQQKLVEEALAGMSRKLLDAHEQERVWIARELHDDITQRLALATVQMSRQMQHTSRSENELREAIQHVVVSLEEIARDVQSLSHRLHSSKLEYLGLGVASASFCNELSQQKKVEIDFRHAGIPSGLPRDLALCLFRVLQEGLQNAVKHSGTRQFRAELHGASGEIQLTVSDLGVGFDPQDAAQSSGLGLVSMRERVRLVNGEFSIESRPGKGTIISARVPVRAEQARAAVG